MKITPAFFVRLVILVLLIAFLLRPALFASLLQPLTENGAPAIYIQNSLLSLAVSHLEIVFIASGAASVVAVGCAILVTRPTGAEFLPLSRLIANIGQAFPPVAALALAVPVLGFGAAPTLLALFLYGLLPIFENALAGLTTLPTAVIDAADGMGMTALQRLLRIELPLALPVILGGIRLSVVIGIATATIGSTVAARTLGEVIIAGLLSNNLAFVVQGGLVVSALSVLIFDFMSFVEAYVSRGVHTRMEQRHE
jgi:osmoprotectant transport system permease protein